MVVGVVKCNSIRRLSCSFSTKARAQQDSLHFTRRKDAFASRNAPCCRSREGRGCLGWSLLGMIVTQGMIVLGVRSPGAVIDSLEPTSGLTASHMGSEKPPSRDVGAAGVEKGHAGLPIIPSWHRSLADAFVLASLLWRPLRIRNASLYRDTARIEPPVHDWMYPHYTHVAVQVWRCQTALATDRSIDR